MMTWMLLAVIAGIGVGGLLSTSRDPRLAWWGRVLMFVPLPLWLGMLTIIDWWRGRAVLADLIWFAVALIASTYILWRSRRRSRHRD